MREFRPVGFQRLVEGLGRRQIFAGFPVRVGHQGLRFAVNVVVLVKGSELVRGNEQHLFLQSSRNEITGGWEKCSAALTFCRAGGNFDLGERKEGRGCAPYGSRRLGERGERRRGQPRRGAPTRSTSCSSTS